MVPPVVVAPTIEPVLLSEAKLRTRAVDEDDPLLQGLIVAAREYCEHRKGYAFYEQTLEVALPYWPSDGRIVLPRATPLRSITSVRYTDSDGTERTVSSSNYRINSRGIAGGLVFISDYSWPDLDLYAPEPVVVRYVAGQPNVSPAYPFPETIKAAMKLLISHWYRNREGVVVGSTAAATGAELPIGVEALLSVNQQLFAF